MIQGDKKKRSSKSEQKRKKKEKKAKKKAEKKAKKDKKKKSKLEKHQDKRGMSAASSLDPFAMSTSSSFEERLAAIRALAQINTSFSRDMHTRDVKEESRDAATSREHQQRGKRSDDSDDKTTEPEPHAGGLGLGGDLSSGKDGDADSKPEHGGSDQVRAEGDASSQDNKTDGVSGSDEATAKRGDGESQVTVTESKPAAPEPVRKPVAEHGAAMTLDQWRAMVSARPEISKVAKGLNAGNEETLKAKVLGAIMCCGLFSFMHEHVCTCIAVS